MTIPSLRLYDSLRRDQVSVVPSRDQAGELITIYTCGVTPYDTGHMGHASTFCAFDVLVRYLESGGHRVRYVQNVTDVDDPLFARARRDGIDWKRLAETQERRYLDDMDLLGWRRPDVMPHVSTEIEGIERAVARLHQLGFAYQTDAVYFEVARYPGYGALSGRTRRSMVRKLADEGMLGQVGPGHKRDALDFPLWRPSAPDEPAWNSEFGPGRPGWHIECSAMAMRYLGETICIHGGGADLRFSHHESERAQSESLTGRRPFAQVWMHTGLVRYAGRKMSKSLGNLVLVPQTLERVPPATVRLYLASHRYRRDWEFRWPALERLVPLTQRLDALVGKLPRTRRPERSGSIQEFQAAMDDDLDTTRALNVLRRTVNQGDAEAAAWMLGILAGDAALEMVDPG